MAMRNALTTIGLFLCLSSYAQDDLRNSLRYVGDDLRVASNHRLIGMASLAVGAGFLMLEHDDPIFDVMGYAYLSIGIGMNISSEGKSRRAARRLRQL